MIRNKYSHNYLNSLKKILTNYQLLKNINCNLSAENNSKLMNNFTEENFIFDINQIQLVNFYEQGNQDLPD